MTVLNLQVSSSADDVKDYGGWQPTSADAAIGQLAGLPQGSWFTWNNVIIPDNSIITAAQILCQEKSSFGSGSSVNVKAAFIDQDNATMPVSQADADSRPMTAFTSPETTWFPTGSGDPWIAIDVTVPVKAIMDRAGQHYGDRLSGHIHGGTNVGTVYIAIYQYDTAAASAAKLDISFTDNLVMSGDEGSVFYNVYTGW